MSDRLHFYLIKKENLSSIRTVNDIDRVAKEVLCVAPYYEMYDTLIGAQKLCLDDIDGKCFTYMPEQIPRIITKQELRELVLQFRQVYKADLIRHLIKLDYSEQYKQLSDAELYNRVLGLGDDEKVKQKDEAHAALWATYLEHLSFFAHACPEKYSGAPDTFEKDLDDKDILTTGYSLEAQLFQLVYLYKSFDDGRVLIAHVW